MEIKQAGVPAVFAVRVASRQRTSRKGIEQRKFAALWSAGPDYAFVRDVSTPQKAVLGVLSMVVRYASGSVVLYPASVGNPAELLALADPRLVRHLEELDVKIVPDPTTEVSATALASWHGRCERSERSIKTLLPAPYTHECQGAKSTGLKSKKAARLYLPKSSLGSLQEPRVPLSTVPWCVLDIEANGSDSQKIIEIAAFRRLPNGQIDAVFETLVNPGEDIVEEGVAYWMHRISGAMVATAPSFADVVPRIAAMISGCVLVGHGMRSDCKWLRKESAACNAPLHQGALLDTSTAIAPHLTGRVRLKNAAKELGVQAPGRAHSAAHDALLTLGIAEWLVENVTPKQQPRVLVPDGDLIVDLPDVRSLTRADAFAVAA